MKLNGEYNLENYIYLMGGLGNQLFQVAAGVKCSQDSGRRLIIDDAYGNFRKNSFGVADVLSYNSLSGLTTNKSVNKGFITRKLIGILIRISFKSRNSVSLNLLRKILRIAITALLSIRFRKPLKLWSATNLGFEKISTTKYSQYLIGYFQTFKFASDPYVKNFMKSLSLSSDVIESYKQLALLETPLIVHIRLGDYSSELKFGVLSAKYYENAISSMIASYNFGKIWVFSDEIDNARSFIPKAFHPLYRWMDDKKESSVVVLEKMRLGSGYIIGNSTFSWWGAFLSHAPNPPTIAPDPWFIGEVDPNDLIPIDWKVISR